MGEIKIRPLCEADISAVENICIETAPVSMCSSEKRCRYTLFMYNRYYTRVREHSFVAVNGSDEPIGYLLCAPDFNSYKSDFSKNELLQIKELGLFYYFCALGELRYIKKYCRFYPAHLHIDILPEYQGKHIGSELMKTLFTHLKSNNVKGLMLSVSPDNKGAAAFYEKCGFKLLAKGPGVIYAVHF